MEYIQFLSYLNSNTDILLFFSLLLLIIFFTLFLSKAHSSSSFVHLSLVSKRQRTKLLKMTAIGSIFFRHISYLNSASFSASRLRLSHSKFWRLHSFSLTTFPPSLVSCKGSVQVRLKCNRAWLHFSLT